MGIKEGIVVWDNNVLKLNIKEGSVTNFERVMLSSGRCDSFMPMGFMKSREGETVCYDCSGFAPLENYRIERTEDALYLLERTPIILGNSLEFLIMPDKVTLTRNTVFYNKDTGQVRIAYVPAAGGEGKLRNHIINFISQLSEDIRDGKGAYLDEVTKYVRYKNYFIKDIVTKVAVIKRRIYAEDANAKTGMDQNIASY